MRDVYVAGTCLVQDKKLVYEDFESIRRELQTVWEEVPLARCRSCIGCKKIDRKMISIKL